MVEGLLVGMYVRAVFSFSARIPEITFLVWTELYQ